MKKIKDIFTSKSFLILAILLIIGLGLFFFLRAKKTTEAKKMSKGTFVVKRGNLKEDLVLSGEIKADEDAVLRFKTSGKLSWVGVKEGDYVKKYQTIASLDTRELKKSLQKKLNSFRITRHDFDQTKDDYDDEVVDDEIKRVLEKSQLTLDNSVIDVELQDIALKYSYLTTPIEGIVTRVESKYAGVNITPAQAEFEVVNPNTLYLSVSADQTEVSGLKTGMQGSIVFDSYPDANYKGKIAYISFAPKTGETGTVYEVKISFLNSNLSGEEIINRYKLGMTGDFSITLRQKDNVLFVPFGYIKPAGRQKVVYVLEGGKKRVKRVVKTGMEANGNVEIISGLREGEQIVY